MAEIRMICPRCGGHMAFPSQIAGQDVSCPHCNEAITLVIQRNLVPWVLVAVTMIGALCLLGHAINRGAGSRARPSVELSQSDGSPEDVFLSRYRDRIGSGNEWDVEKEISISGGICSIVLNPREFALRAFHFFNTPDGEKTSLSSFRFFYSEEGHARNVLETFLRWADIASTNNAESFQKVIETYSAPGSAGSLTDPRRRTFTFLWSTEKYLAGASLTHSAEGSDYADTVGRSDVVAFSKLLESLPALKMDLVAKIRRREDQDALFGTNSP